jgi:epoxyqueuosine reductase
MSLKDHLKNHALSLGFDRVGIAAAVPPPGYARFVDWLAAGYAGEMRYLDRQRVARGDPRQVFSEVRSIVMVAMNHRQPPATAGAVEGRIAAYAVGADYHEVLWTRLEKLLDWLQRQVPECHGRAIVDTAPLLERDFGQQAGLGWFGKNTMLINKQLGSFFFLGALLVSLDLAPDVPHATSHCGTCTACLEACPTQAFTAPGLLDARRCISYLTIELKGPVPEDLRPGLGNWIFGCDVCQDVCPWNRKAPLAAEPAFQARDGGSVVQLSELLALTPDEFRRRFRHTALWRTKRRGLLRNAALALGNSGQLDALPALAQALRDAEPLVRGAAAWAMGRLGFPAGIVELERALNGEVDPVVAGEIAAALAKLLANSPRAG